jgi:hypothetical protein
MTASSFKDATQPELYLKMLFVPRSKHALFLLQNHYINVVHRKVPFFLRHMLYETHIKYTLCSKCRSL